MVYRWPHILACSLPLLGGLAFFGWRGAIVIAAVLGSGLLAGLLLERIGLRGKHFRRLDLCWTLLAVTLLLPASMATLTGVPWAIGCAILAAVGVWAFGGPATSRVPIPALVILLLGVVQVSRLVQPAVLPIHAVFVGDALHADEASAPDRPWYREPGSGAVSYVPPAIAIQRHTFGLEDPANLLRDELPPLADVVIGATPTFMGGSVLLVIVGLLLLAKTNRFDALVPTLGAAAAYVVLMAVPHAGNGWVLFGSFRPGWLAGLTFVHYELLGGPLLLTLGLLAAMPGIRPLTLQGRIVFATVLGVASAIAQVYFSVSLGPLVALCVAALLTPMLDRHALPRPLL